MSDFGDMSNRISKFRKNLKQGLTDATKDALRRMQQEVKVELRRNRSIARRTLLRGIEVDHNTSRGELLIASSVEAPQWARYLEYGTGSRGRQSDDSQNHKQYSSPSKPPPINNIIKWIMAKNITPTEYDTIYGLAGAIQEVLFHKGQFARPFMRPVWYDIGRGWESVVTANHQEMKTQLRRL